MKMEKLKNDNQIPVGAKLLKAETSFESDTCKRATLHFDNGKVIEFAYGSYQMDARVSAAPVMTSVFTVDGKLFGTQIVKHFDDLRNALKFRDKIRDAGALVGEPQQNEVEEDTVEIVSSDDIPF